MNLNDLLLKRSIDPQKVLVLRHRPYEPKLNKMLPWLIAEKPELFDAFQKTQAEAVEKAMTQASHLASFIRYGAGKALFIGLYSIGRSKPLTSKQYWAVPAHRELKDTFGMEGFHCSAGRPSILSFDLKATDFFSSWKGKLVVGWPPPERSWWRRAHRNRIPVLSILEESALDAEMPEWDEINLTWEELGVLPTSWKSALSQWRGIYYIFDAADGKGYVGSAYGEANLLGRWLKYAAVGHGGNRLLRRRDARNFRFSILQRVSPDMEPNDVIRLECTWKGRLHTRTPFGLNDN